MTSASSRLGAAVTSLSFAASLLPLGLPAATAQTLPAFSDIQSSSYKKAIESLKAKGVVEGYGDLTFRPNARINRAEFLKIILEARGKVDADGKNCFPDVTTQWFAKYVCAAKDESIVSGYPDGSFKPEQDIAFTEAAKILSLAYKQQVQAGSDWYEGYARALEGSKAIPPTVAQLDSKVTRGEMAEMMWRLSENKTDEPAKGYLNVKYPELSINTSSDDVQNAKTCRDLEAFMQRAGQGGGMDMYYEKALDGAMPPPAATQDESATRQSNPTGSGPADDYSKTNVQVEGVDEGDVVKTDGTNLYVLSQGTVRILKANPGSALKKLSEISFAGELEKQQSGSDEYWGIRGGFQPTDLYIENGKLIVLGSDYGAGPSPYLREKAAESRMMIWPPYYGSSRSIVKIFDVSNPEKPSEVRTVAFDGNTISSRRIGNKFYLVLNAPLRPYGDVHIMEKAGSATDGSVPMMEDSASGQTRAVVGCADVAILPRVPSPQYMIVSVIPLDNAKGEVKNSVVLGNAENIYMSTENLYIASTDYRYTWMPMMRDTGSSMPEYQPPVEQTRLYRFRLSADGADYAARGEVPGHILNQFSMDENGSVFRIATTLNQDWSNPNSKSSNALYTLNRELDPLGKIEGIAPGETIYAARFLGNRVYLVTFKQVDPLFVIDVSDARNPKILGKLKIPGYSNYLHPIDENHVLGIGKEVDESIDADKVHSDDAVYYTAIQGVKLAVFDVRDVSNPKELWKEVVGDRGSDTPVTTNHKALLYEPDRKLLALPMLVTKRPAGSEKSADGNPVFQGAYVYDLSVADGFKLRGTITHHDNASDFLKAGSYWYGSPLDIQRIVRIGNSLLTVSDGEVKSSTLSTLKEEASVTYPVQDYNTPMYMQ